MTQCSEFQGEASASASTQYPVRGDGECGL